MRLTNVILMLRLMHCAALFTALVAAPLSAEELRVGAAAVNLQADDSMVISGGIGPRFAKGQEGQLRAVAVVVAKSPREKAAIVACDVLFVTRDLVDPAIAEIERRTGIPAANILVNATHTHHAPSTTTLHGYDRNEVFCRRLREAIVASVVAAHARLDRGTAQLLVGLGEEKTVGQNSRLMLGDRSIFWIGDRADATGPTGPLDPQLSVLAFRAVAGPLRAIIFNHSTHPIGTRQGGDVRSPSFYGLAAQELEAELGATVEFLEGASGSTHNLSVGVADAVQRIKQAVKQTLDTAQPHTVTRLAGMKQRFTFKVRHFDETAEDEKVVAYCRKRAPEQADQYIAVFRGMRRALKPEQGRQRDTLLQVILLGDVAIVGVPAEYFTGLGMDIKRRSPFRTTIIAELANDWIGYLPDREAMALGGYQTWMGQHSFAEVGTGERVADAVIEMLNQLVGKT